jgi:hypothetical protein
MLSGGRSCPERVRAQDRVLFALGEIGKNPPDLVSRKTDDLADFRCSAGFRSSPLATIEPKAEPHDSTPDIVQVGGKSLEFLRPLFGHSISIVAGCHAEASVRGRR